MTIRVSLRGVVPTTKQSIQAFDRLLRSLRRPRNDVAGVLLVLSLTSYVYAQGILPAKQASPMSPSERPYRLIGDTISQNLTVLDANGVPRPLLSYKTSTHALVAGFYSPRCALNQSFWNGLRRFYEEYQDWHVSFIGVSVNSDEAPAELAEAMSQARLPYPVVRDDQQKLAKALHVTVLPEIVIIDEWSQLRYRGPLEGVRAALDAVLGQEQVKTPEPGDLRGCAIQ